MRLQDLIGQDLARAALERAVAGGRVAHAYLFEGPPGVGKRSAALGLALALDCPVAPGAGAASARSAAGSRRASTRTSPRSAVRTGRPDRHRGHPGHRGAGAQSRPHEAPARVIVVDDADALNANAANGLLKTLEEPLARNHLVLCTSAPDRLLPTVRSRSQRVRFRALAPPRCADIARAHGIPEARAEIAAALADGSAARMLEAAAPRTRRAG